jgi:outer membrane protein OmpA-like peptidoglycan-associated protein
MNLIAKAALWMLLSSCTGISFAQGYRGIVPLHSTCEDVKRILGVTTCSPANEFYEFEAESVRITFSKKLCDIAFRKAWNVQPGTVLVIERILRRHLPISELGIDLRKYKIQPLENDVNTIVYENPAEGVSYWTTGGAVSSIYYSPATNDQELLCCNQPEATTQQDKFEPSTTPFDRYGDLTSGEEQKRLDVLGQELKGQPINTQVYIVVYTGHRLQKDEARVRAHRVKDYLEQAYGITAGRIKTKVVGQGEKFEVVIYIVQGG